MSWTDERVEKLKTLWEKGKSASEIAKELGDVTRNAVIGKVHRMGLQSRTVTNTGGDDAKPAKVAKPKAEPKKAASVSKPIAAEKPIEDVELPEPKDIVPVGAGNDIVPRPPNLGQDEISEAARQEARRVEKKSKKLDLMQLTERTCKWPIGDPATDEFWFCGHPSQAGKPYCEAHVELAFQAPNSRR